MLKCIHNLFELYVTDFPNNTYISISYFIKISSILQKVNMNGANNQI